jgi:hypothetical protein
LDGPQKLWDRTQRKGFAVRDLWDVNRIGDDYLKYLKNIVGWTNETILKGITERLSDAQLRKLIGASIALWRIRGSEEAYGAIVRIVTEARLRIWSWFDYRYIVEETSFGEDRQGRDPYLIPVDDETLSDIRIVDNGSLDRELVRLMVQLFKPGGEKVEIHWIDFLDLFTSAGNDVQWFSVAAGAPVVIDGSYTLLDDTAIEEVATNIVGDEEWTDYLVYYRVRFAQTAGTSSVRFFYLNSTDHYKVEFDISANTLILSVVIAGADTVLATYSFADHSQTLVADVYYGVRIVTENISSPTATTIAIWVDGTERVTVATSLGGRQTKGKLTVRHEVGATIEMSEIEMSQIPMDSSYIGLNGIIS